MPKEEWGVKRVCPNCSTRFYDLQRDPMVCPSCGHSMSLESLTSGKGRTLVADKSDKASKQSSDDESLADDVVLDDDDDDSDVDLGDDVLEDDDEDVSLDDIADVSTDDDES
ncbi:TIGR02300 family protein [Actibacterium ureilyticum]|uniref:TIGR02300 family protein n=1 Tax=Actibacterium ureilyticum TaxID=1590614 RepID=UPI000BAAF7A5|nr:TIGR02300 family protein [Actibacterium ureilyticum]